MVNGMKTEKKRRKILIVEDQAPYRNAAKEYFSRRQDIESIYAIDYVSAQVSLTGIEGVLLDCFFPIGKGCRDIVLGKEAVEAMAQSDPAERMARDLLVRIGDYVDVTDETIKKYVRIMARFHRSESQDDFVSVVEIFGKYYPKEFATDFFKKQFENHFGKYSSGVWSENLYQIMLAAMEESEDNQPLGIAFGNRILIPLRKPFILVTSTYHHDRLTQPIADYATRRNWALIDCKQGKSGDKATIEFWETAYKCLEERILCFNSLHYIDLPRGT